MPIRSREDAVEVQDRIQHIFAAPASDRGAAVRSLFVEVLDFNPASGHVDLGAAPSSMALPTSAERVAYSDGVQVAYLALEKPESDRVGKGEAATAAKLINQQLDGDLLLVVTNSSASQLHLVYPNFDNVRPVLRRMVVERDLPRRTAVQQVSNIYWKHRDTGSIQIALDEAFDVEPVTREFVKGGEKVYHCGGGIVYHRHDEKGLNWEPDGIRSGAGVRSSGVSQESTGSSDTWEAALCRLCLRR